MAESFIDIIGGDPSPSGKTQTWVVAAKAGGDLGEIRWFGRWRRYAFYPLPQTVFEQNCLRDIANFCETETQRHRERKQT